MCGIAGIIGNEDPAAVGRVTAMADSLVHRGPDSGQVVRVPGAVLGHRRLSIIDLSIRGSQPMASPDGRFSIVYNGELYNYRELRSELASSWEFSSDSDTEVLLAALVKWGARGLDKLNGMFAFCFYDSQKHEAFLARDRFGQKPLYLAEEGGSLLFASEVKALMAAGLQPRPNLAVWARYLEHARYDDSEDSFFAGVTQLLPGECAHFSPGRPLRRQRWYDIVDHVAGAEPGLSEARERVRALLVDAARLHMRADVPVGISLSGGLDSSALLACLDLAGELSANVRCISVDFGGDLTERPWIEAAAGHHNLSSTVLGYSPGECHAHIRPLTWHLEGPIGGLMNCALAPVMARARQDDIIVMQDGTGLDEAFGGYRNHHNLYLGLALRDGRPGAERALMDYCANWSVGPDEARKAAMSALHQSVTAIDGTVPVRPELLQSEFLSKWRAPLPPPRLTDDPLRDAFASYLQVEKIPRNTRMKDRLSMAYSIELRLPFLDHRLVECGLSLPADLLFLHGQTKSIIREAMSDAMNDGVRTAAKRSIQAPQGLWLRQEPMRSYVQELISSDRFASRGIFNPDACQAAFDRFCMGADTNSFFVWQWINTEEWFRIFIDGDPVRNQIPLIGNRANYSEPSIVSA